MNESTLDTTTASGADASLSRSPLAPARILEVARSVGLGVTLMIIVGLLTALGTVIIQDQQPDFYTRRYGAWLGRLILALEWDRIFYSTFFLYLLGIFSVNLFLSTISRPLTLRYLGFHLAHTASLLVLAGGFYGGLTHRAGFIRLQEGQMGDRFLDKKGRGAVQLGFGVKVDDFTIHYNPPQAYLHIIDVDAGKSVGTKEVLAEGPFALPGTPYTIDVTDLRIPPAPPSDTGKTTPGEMAVEFTFATGDMRTKVRLVDLPGADRRPIAGAGGKNLFAVLENRTFVKDYTSILAVIEPDALGRAVVVKRQEIEVNHPLWFAGYAFYQSAYDQDEQGRHTITVLQAVSDPGLPLVWAGLGMLALGVVYSFWIKPYLPAAWLR